MAGLQAGNRIHNYLLEERLGAGSFGEVWRARHHIFDERVAIKIPTDRRFVRQLQHEGMAIHGLRHPNIVRAIDLDPYAEPPYLIMEYVAGPSLRAVIDHQKSGFPIAAATTILRGVLHALAAAHAAGMIHRDVKPPNILLDIPADRLNTVTEQDVKVTDFGLGRVGGELAQSMLQSGSILTEEGRSISGTLAYMSPEQREGAAIDARTDLYACGIVLYEMLTGERPQGSDLPSALRPGAPGVLDEVFRRSYTRLDRRFSSAQQMLAALSPGPPPIPDARGGGRFAGAVPTGERNCPECGTATFKDDQFCVGCGRQLVLSVPRCPACAAFVHSNDRFCIFCGKDLGVLA
jgi:serine/threonine-protein kinase